MGFDCGIVGLPNVGKSTLFNALTRTAAAEAANYPFCTIEPNAGRVAVPDPRLERVAALAGSPKSVPAFIEFTDIAGLVRGASRGEGLGNRFLGAIRETQAIVHVLRCFDGGEVVHVDGSVDPVRDAETVATELMLADLESLERRAVPTEKRARGGDKEARARLAVMGRLIEALAAGRPARSIRDWSAGEAALAGSLGLLTSKPVLYACNVGEEDAARGNAASAAVARLAEAEGAERIVVSAAIEAEVAGLASDGERRDFMAALGLGESGLDRLIRAGYRLLGLLTFFTAGPKEARAWTVRRGATAPAAAGAVHTDFERGFIRAETISFEDFDACGGEQGAREAGRMRAEGADYKVRDGDVLRFRFNV